MIEIPSFNPWEFFRFLLMGLGSIFLLLFLIGFITQDSRSESDSESDNVQTEDTSESAKSSISVSELIETPDIDFDDVGGMNDIINKLENKIIDPKRNPEEYKKFDAPASNGILFYGPPGCGKTHIAQALAGELNIDFVSITASDIVSPWIGQQAKNISDLFDKIRQNQPCLLFLDEFEAIASERADLNLSMSNSEKQRVTELLTQLQAIQNEDVIVVAATNYRDQIDNAILRNGRINEEILISPPDQEAREDILKVHLSGRPLEDDIDFETLAAMATGFAGSDIETVADEAARIAAQENDDLIRELYIEEAIQETNSSVENYIDSTDTNMGSQNQSNSAGAGELTADKPRPNPRRSYIDSRHTEYPTGDTYHSYNEPIKRNVTQNRERLEIKAEMAIDLMENAVKDLRNPKESAENYAEAGKIFGEIAEEIDEVPEELKYRQKICECASAFFEGHEMLLRSDFKGAAERFKHARKKFQPDTEQGRSNDPPIYWHMSEFWKYYAMSNERLIKLEYKEAEQNFWKCISAVDGILDEQGDYMDSNDRDHISGLKTLSEGEMHYSLAKYKKSENDYDSAQTHLEEAVNKLGRAEKKFMRSDLPGSTIIQNRTTAEREQMRSELENIESAGRGFRDEYSTEHIRKAIELAEKCSNPSEPKDGAVLLKDGDIHAEGWRNQHGEGEHAIYNLLINNISVDNNVIQDSLIITTLEPCTEHRKLSCTEVIIEKYKKNENSVGVVAGLRGLTETGKKSAPQILQENAIFVDSFPPELVQEAKQVNAPYIEQLKSREYN